MGGGSDYAAFAWDGHRLRHTPYTCGTVGFLSQADNAQSASILVINNSFGILAASGSGSRRQIIDPSRFLALDCVIAACQNWLSIDFYAEILGVAGKSILWDYCVFRNHRLSP
jgi:hypothetical protein